MRILVTGSRAPASVDIIYSLIRQGHEVYSADSMIFPLGRFVKGLKKHFVLPKPNLELIGFFKAIKMILIKYQIELLIPTCEEIFFIGQMHDEFSQYSQLFCESFARLNLLHNKYEFNQLALQYGLDAPESWLLNTLKDKKKIPINQEIILKPIFSRFASKIIIKPTQKIIDDLSLTEPYIAQQFLTGKECCAYAIAHQGEILLFSCYHPKYTAGKAAGIYFEPVEIESIFQFVQIFCQKYQFSGQIAFDFILKGNKAFVLECNPRTTSGFHLIADQIDWGKILNAKKQKLSFSKQPLMFGFAMKFYGLKYLYRNAKIFIADYLKANDILNGKTYPGFGICNLLCMGNILLRMIQGLKNFHNASTNDIEFNGIPNKKMQK